MNAVIYTRFSPRKNADESESCETQEGICRKFAEEKGYTIAAVFHDKDVSGADEYREQLWQAIEALSKDGVLLVFKRDRLARNVYLSEQINRAVEGKGAAIIAVSGDVIGNGPEQIMIRQVLAAVSEYERKMIASRTSFAMRQHQRNGRRMGRFAPYGYILDHRDKSRLIEAPGEQEAIKVIKSMRGKGKKPGEIAKYLNLYHPSASRGKEWSITAVTRIIGRL